MSCPGERERGYLPFAIDLVEDQIVVTTSDDKAVERGDVLVSIDGRPAKQLLAFEAALVSGSPQWRVVRGLQRLGSGPIGPTLALRLRRGDTELGAAVSRIDRRVSELRSHPPIDRLGDGVYYVDLSRASTADINAVLDRLATAPGVIFDLREYPKLNDELLSHLLTRKDDLKGWELIPLVVRPDSGSAPAAWEDTSTWNMPPTTIAQPHISGRVAYLTGPRAISMGESVMAIVEHYHLGEIVGAATPGTNGDIAQISMPTGCSTYFTARRVTRPDGGRHHLIGIQPTIPASRTIGGVLAGRDEVLERALAYVHGDSR